MSIILTILKVIGIILLIILLIILAVLLLLLFVPFRYSAGGRKEGDVLEFSGKVTWLLHAVTVQVGFEPGGAGLTKDLRIFGISLLKLKEKLTSGKKGAGGADPSAEEDKKIAEEKALLPDSAEGAASPESGENGGTNSAAAPGTEDDGTELPADAVISPEKTEEPLPETEEVMPDEHTGDKEDPFSVQEKEAGEQAGEDSENGTADASGDQVHDGEGGQGSRPEEGGSRIKAAYGKVTERIFSVLTNIAKRLNGIIGKLFQLVLKIFIRICLLPLTIVEKLDAILRKIGKIFRKIGAFSDFLFDEKVQTFLSGIMGMLKKLIGHVLPRKLKGYVRFGLDDPGRTGRVLAAVAPFYPKYGKTFSLEPDFEELVLEGK
ncbi:MAG: hypothetical protein J6D46_07460, partial [Lachnospiraceae bacterium]|nr:hypothetical protein [Lachnospiraceae bacterium]